MRLSFFTLLFFAGNSILLYSCGNHDSSATSEPKAQTPVINYAVSHYYPHDTSLFTEGLLFHNGALYESTGSPQDLPWLRSMIGTIDLQTGKMAPKAELDKSKYFGEGIVFLNNKLYQLTYKSQKGFVYNATTFKLIDSFAYKNTEGWSLTTDSANIIMDDGTDQLTYLDTATLQPVKTLAVTENGASLDNLNELEYIKGYIYANIWKTTRIVKIDPANGQVVGQIDLNSLAMEASTQNAQADVLNGIAYDPATDKIYVTGKLWPHIYEISFPH